MKANLKDYIYYKNTDAALDVEFNSAKPFGRAKLGEGHIFWKRV